MAHVITDAAGRYLHTWTGDGTGPTRPKTVEWSEARVKATLYRDADHAGRAIAALGLADARAVDPEAEEDAHGEPRKWYVRYQVGPGWQTECVLARSGRAAQAKVIRWRDPVATVIVTTSPAPDDAELSDWPAAREV